MPRRHREAEKDHRGLIEPNHILVVEPPDLLADLRPRNRGDLVHHQPRRGAQLVALVGLDGQPEQRRSLKSVVKARIVMESVASKLSLRMITFGRGSLG